MVEFPSNLKLSPQLLSVNQKPQGLIVGTKETRREGQQGWKEVHMSRGRRGLKRMVLLFTRPII